MSPVVPFSFSTFQSNLVLSKTAMKLVKMDVENPLEPIKILVFDRKCCKMSFGIGQ